CGGRKERHLVHLCPGACRPDRGRARNARPLSGASAPRDGRTVQPSPERLLRQRLIQLAAIAASFEPSLEKSMARKAKCGVYNMAWEKWEDHIELGRQSEAAGHKVQFFTDLMVRYLFKEQGEQIFGKEALAPGSVGGIKSNGVIAVPYGSELMGVTDPLLVMPQVAEHTKDMEL